MWDIDTLDCVRVLEGHNEAVLALAVGPSFLVSGSYDTTVRFWALESLRCVRCALMPVLTTCSRPPCLHRSLRHHRALLGARVPALRQARSLMHASSQHVAALHACIAPTTPPCASGRSSPCAASGAPLAACPQRLSSEHAAALQACKA